MTVLKPRRWPRRLLKLFLWTGGSLVLLWTVTFALATWELNRLVAELKARGEPTTFAEAVAGNLEKAGENHGGELIRQALKENERIGRPGDQLVLNGAVFQTPIPAEGRETIAAAIHRGQSVFALMDRWEEATPAPLIDILDVELLQEGIGIESVHQTRSLARLLSADARFSVATGDSRRAHRRVTTLYRLSEHLAGDIFAIPQFVRVAILGVTTAMLRDVLPVADFTRDELTELDVLLDRLERTFIVAPALVNQRALMASIFDNPRALADQLTSNASGRPMATFSERGWNAADVLWRQLVSSPIGLPVRRRAAAQSLAVPDQVLKLVDTPPPWTETQTKSLNEWSDKFDVGRVAIVPTNSNVASVMATAALRARRNLAMMRLAVRLKRFHLQHGKLPAKLEDLCDASLPEMPTKWFEKQPFIYTTKGDSFRIEVTGVSVAIAGLTPGREDLQMSFGLLMKMDFASKK